MESLKDKTDKDGTDETAFTVQSILLLIIMYDMLCHDNICIKLFTTTLRLLYLNNYYL